MFINMEGAKYFPNFTYFSKERNVDGAMLRHTETQVFGVLSDGIKRTDPQGNVTWTNDYWNVIFTGEAYEAALQLSDHTRIGLERFTIRNIYRKETKTSYQLIYVYAFHLQEAAGSAEEAGNEVSWKPFV